MRGRLASETTKEKQARPQQMSVIWDGMNSRNRVVRLGHTGTFPLCPFLPVVMVQWDGMDSRNRVVRVGHTGTFPMCPFLPMVQWDGMDSRNRVVRVRTDWYIHSVSIPFHGIHSKKCYAPITIAIVI